MTAALDSNTIVGAIGIGVVVVVTVVNWVAKKGRDQAEQINRLTRAEGQSIRDAVYEMNMDIQDLKDRLGRIEGMLGIVQVLPKRPQRRSVIKD